MTGTEQTEELAPSEEPGTEFELTEAEDEEPRSEVEAARSEVEEAGPEAEEAEPGAEEAGPETPRWRRHPNGRWIIGDAGSQPMVVATPSTFVRRRPDVALDGGRVAGVDFRAVSLRGFSHLESGKPRQDSYVVTTTRDDNWLVGCVADGVSEGKLSHRAADLACEKIVGELIDGLAAAGGEADPAALRWDVAVRSANSAITEEFLAKLRSSRREQGFDEDEVSHAEVRRHMSSTAVAFAVATRPDETGEFPAVVAAIAGDSSAILLRDGRWQPVTDVKGEGQEVASSAVRPLPRETVPAPQSLRLRAGDVLAVITDGIGDPMGSGSGVVGRFLAEQWAAPPDLIEFAHQAGFYRRTFMDDRTVVAVWVASEHR